MAQHLLKGAHSRAFFARTPAQNSMYLEKMHLFKRAFFDFWEANAPLAHIPARDGPVLYNIRITVTYILFHSLFFSPDSVQPLHAH